MNPTTAPDVVSFIGALLVLAAMVTIYFLPAFIAIGRHHHQTAAITIVNLFLGWTLLGWVVALAWAASAVQARRIALLVIVGLVLFGATNVAADTCCYKGNPTRCEPC